MIWPLMVWPFRSTVMPSAPMTSPFPGPSSRSLASVVSWVTTAPQASGWARAGPTPSVSSPSAKTTRRARWRRVALAGPACGLPIPGTQQARLMAHPCRLSKPEEAGIRSVRASGSSGQPVAYLARGPTQQAGVLDLEAVVLDVGETGVLGDGAGLGAGDAELEPEGAGAAGDRLAGHLGGVLGAAEDVDDVDRLGDLVEGGDHRDAEDLLLGALGVDPEQAVALVVEVPGDLVGRAVGVGREADHGDRLGVEQQLAELFVVHGHVPCVGGWPGHGSHRPRRPSRHPGVVVTADGGRRSGGTASSARTAAPPGAATACRHPRPSRGCRAAPRASRPGPARSPDPGSRASWHGAGGGGCAGPWSSSPRRPAATRSQSRSPRPPPAASPGDSSRASGRAP